MAADPSAVAVSQRVLVPKELCDLKPFPATEVVLLAAFHAFLTRTNNQEVTAIALQPSSTLQPSLQDADSDHLLVIPCLPALDSAATIALHASVVNTAVLSAPRSAAVPYQAAVALDMESAAAAAHASSLGVALLLRSNDGGRGLVAELVFKPAYHATEATRLMAQHLQVFLSQLAHADSAGSLLPLLHAPLMEAKEEQLVLKGFNQNHKDYDTTTFVHSMFAQHAKRCPEAPCVIFEGCVYSYAHIDAASNQIAHYLRNKAGAVPGDIIGVLLLRGPLMVTALLAVLKAGCGYLPLDHHHPDTRMEFMLQDAAVKAVIIQPDLLHKLPSSGHLHTLLLDPEKASARQPATQPAPPVAATISAASLGAAAQESAQWGLGQLGGPDTPCYTIYTSGSTGKPKGVVVLHKGLTAYTAWFRSHFSITSDDTMLQQTPTNFDASCDELWTSLSAGARLVVAPPEVHRDVHSVMQLITRYGVTTASAVPSKLQALAREILSSHSPEDAAARAAPCASLKRVLSGGEALTVTMATEVKAALPHCELHNSYGPTETTVGITSWLYTHSDNDHCSSALTTIPIGRGIHNAHLYVLDARLQPVPVGVPGQLFISGVQVTAGYLNRTNLTEEVFVPNPFCEGPGTHTDKMYRTGDLVLWLPGQRACLGCLGRVDYQVKLRGFRIELQEVEAALGALPGVRQAVTALVKNPVTGADHLVAWVSPADLDRAALLQQLQGSLPDYMVPSAVVLMQALPLLVSEKVDRKSLPPPDFSRDVVTTGPAAATGASDSGLAETDAVPDAADPLTLFVAAVWSEVLGLQAAAVMEATAEDFFALGGNSLLAGQMNSTLRAGLSLTEMSGMLIYQYPNLSAFVAALAQLDPHVPALPGLGISGFSGNSSSLPPSYFASLRQASFSSLSSVRVQDVPALASSSVSSYTSHDNSFARTGGMRASSSSPNLTAGRSADGVMLSAFGSAQPPSPDMPRLETVFSGVDAGGGVLKQLSRSFGGLMSKNQPPVALAPGAAASDSSPHKLSRVLTTESLSLHTTLSASVAAGDADQLRIRGAHDSMKHGESRLPSFTFDQDRPSSDTVGRSNNSTAKDPAGCAQAHDDPGQQQQQPHVKPSLALATCLQLFSVCVVTGVSAMLTLAPMLVSMYLMLEVGWRALVFLPAFELGGWLLLALWSIGGKWVLIGRYRECEVPLWGTYYLRHYMAHLFLLSARQTFVPLVRRTNLLNWFYRALGARVGRGVVIDTDDVLGFDLVELQDDCILDAASGVTAIQFEAGNRTSKYPHGTMHARAVCVGKRAVVGPNAMVTPGRVAPDSVVLPCSATSNPPSVWRGSNKPTFGPEARAAVNTRDAALGVGAGLVAMWTASFSITLLAYPLVVGYWYLFLWLAGTTAAAVDASSWSSLNGEPSTLACWVHGGDSRPAETAAACTHLMQATLLAMVALPVSALIAGQLLVVLVIPFKWLLRFYETPAQNSTPLSRTWWQRFRRHLQQCILDHLAVRTAAFLWMGTALFNAWLRALGAKVGRQAWIGEDLHLTHHELVEIGDAVSICSAVSLLPSAALGAAKISIMGGADVTNQTALYPGVTVKPGAVLGVFTYAEAGRTFPRHSITQGPMVLSPGQPDPLSTPATPQPSPAKLHETTATPTTPSTCGDNSPFRAGLTAPVTHRTCHSPTSSASPAGRTLVPAPTPLRASLHPAAAGAVYKSAVAAADEPEPSVARLVSAGRYLWFNLRYITLMCMLMPVHAVLLSAPSAVVTVTLMFQLNWWAALLLAPVTSGLQLAITIAWMALLKKMLLPRCRGSHPFYSWPHTAWMAEGLLLYYQQIGFVRYISGSQLAVWYYRALGAKIGQGVLLNGLHSQEPDCLTIGDGTVIDEMTFIMCHTVENRTLKFHNVVVGAGVTIGCGSCVLPGCYIGDGANLGDVSLLMKGEMMPPGSVWKGVPAVPCVAARTRILKA